MTPGGVGGGPELVGKLDCQRELGDIHSDERWAILSRHINLLLVRRADDLPAAAQATVRVERPVRPAPLLLTHEVQASRANRAAAGRGVAGCRPPLPFTGQGELASRLSPWPVNLQEPTP